MRAVAVRPARRRRSARRRRPGPGRRSSPATTGRARSRRGRRRRRRRAAVQRRSISMPGAIVGRGRRGRWVSAKRRTWSIAWSSARRIAWLEARRGRRGGRRARGRAGRRGDRRRPARWRRGRPCRRGPGRRPGSPGRARGRRVRDGAAADERVVVAASVGVAGGDGREVEPTEAERRRRRSPRPSMWRSRRAHGTIFSIGRTRIPDAPAALSRGSRPQTSSAPTTEWIAIIPAWASGMIGRRFEGRQERLELGQRGRRGVHHQVLAAARGDDRAEHRVDRGELGALVAVGRGVGDRGSPPRRGRRRSGAGRSSPASSRRDEIDDPLGETESRRDLDGARDRDDLDRDRPVLEEPAGGVRVRRRDAAGRPGPRRSGSGVSFGTAAARRQRP